MSEQETPFNPAVDMTTFIGTKIVKSFPMTRKQYCAYRGWDMPENEDPLEEVYLVEYEPAPSSKPNHKDHEGYITMSPKHVFDKAYRSTSAMNFGLAVEALKQGKKVARSGWNGKEMFVFLVAGSTFKANRPPLNEIYPEGTEINYRPHMDLRTADGSIATWAPSGSDALADDWIVID